MLQFSSIFIGCNDLPLDRKILSIKTLENLSRQLLSNLVRIKKHGLSMFFNVINTKNITVLHLSPITTLLVLVKYPITSMCDSSWLSAQKWLPFPQNTETNKGMEHLLLLTLTLLTLTLRLTKLNTNTNTKDLLTLTVLSTSISTNTYTTNTTNY